MVDPVLRAEGLCKDYGRARGRWGRRAPAGRPALLDVSLTLGVGEIVGVVGESGSGKSTLARCLTLLETPDAGAVYLRDVRLDQLRPRELRRQRRRVQTVFQDPYGSLNPLLTVGATLREVLAVHRLATGAAADARVRELLELVGLPADAQRRRPADFSGGQRQRICIARALATEPEVLIADESVSALDVSIQAQILNLLRTLRAELGLSMLFISHDLGVVQYVADRSCVMFGGRIVETLGPRTTLAQARHPYTQALHRAAPSLRAGLPDPPPRGVPVVPTVAGCPFRGRCPYASDVCTEVDPALAPLGPGHLVACHHADETADETAGDTAGRAGHDTEGAPR